MFPMREGWWDGRSRLTHSQRVFVGLPLRAQWSFSIKAGASFGISLFDFILPLMMS